MDQESHHRKYDQATWLYKEGKHAEALEIFEGLAVERPSSLHVLYSRGLCLAALGRMDEAQAICATLARQRTDRALKLKVKLEEVLRAREKKKKEWVSHHPSGLEHSDEFARSTPASNAKRFGLVAAVIACVAVGAIAFIVHGQRSRPVPRSADGGPTSVAAPAPDQFMEAPTFYPLGQEKAFTVALFLAAPENISSKPEAKINDRVGGPAAGNWDTIKAHAEKALVLNHYDKELVGGKDRGEMVHTVVFPREGLTLAGALADKTILTFSPESSATLSHVIAACGKPDHEETWEQLSSAVGLRGTVHWWGRTGLAADDTGAITHLLVRSYTVDKK